MTEPKFTDAELAYLKAELPHNESILFQSAKKAFRLEALIARLEAAEKRMAHCNMHMKLVPGCPPCEADEAWRRVSGK